ncbi:glycine C-acetyltransferase [Guggenheimella bovis]
MKEELRELALKCGADAVGFTTVEPLGPVAPLPFHFACHDEKKRISPLAHFPEAKSAMVILKGYDLFENALKENEFKTASAAKIDYHLTVRTILEAIQEKMPFKSVALCDTEGLLERRLAARAGLGFIGKNHFLIHPRLGSATNIGVILLEKELEPDQPLEATCGSCKRCVLKCTVGALRSGDLTRCVSALTQDKEAIFSDLNGFLYGCDECQKACPYNKVQEMDPDFIFTVTDFDLSNREFKQRYQERDFAWIGKKTLVRNLSWNKRSRRMENIHELGYLKEKIDGLKKDGVYRKLPILEGPNGGRIILDGKEVINLSANNYLGFANHDRIKKASIRAIEEYGAGSGAVRTIIGNLKIHEDLEKILAEFKREEAVMVYQSGFNCNAGTIQAITDKGDLIISDELNHASIIDGVRLSKADKAVFKHSDMADLERILKETEGKYNTRLIITDGVFSMDGDIAKLPEIVDLAEKYGALTYVDDAHGSGVLGENGRGTVDHFKLHGRVDFIIGTLSKALGVIGGYVAGSKVMYDWLSHRGRPILFSTSLTPASCGALIEAVKMLMESSEYTDKLWDNARYFKEELGKLGFNTGHSETPITPVIVGEEAKTMEFSRALKEKGVFVSPIVFPTVPRGTGRLRCMVSAAHNKEDLKEAARIFGEVGRELGIIK